MDLKSNHNSPVIADTVTISKSRLGLPSNLASYSSASSAYPPGLHVAVPRRKTMLGKLDEARCGGWFDLMIASSPPRKKLNRDFLVDSASDETDALYQEWMINHPSALSSLEKMTQLAKSKKVVLFLDYDGTLSPIVDNPDLAFMSNAMRAAVKKAAEYFPTAIISGRSRNKVFDFVKLPELYYAGSHGMDIMGPVRDSVSVGDHPDCVRTTDKQGKEVHLFQPASEFLPIISKVFVSFIELTKDIKGVVVENNEFCVSVHYRNVDQKHWDEVGNLVHEYIKAYPCLKVTYGRKVFEVRPIIDWNKGKAVEFLLESLSFSNCDDVLPIYVGDDRTDEDAFKVLKEKKHGFGILVSTVPKETNAFFSLRDPSEVMEFLSTLVDWKKSAISQD